MRLDREEELYEAAQAEPVLKTLLDMRHHAQRAGAPLTDEEWYHFALTKMVEVNAATRKAYLEYASTHLRPLVIER